MSIEFKAASSAVQSGVNLNDSPDALSVFADGSEPFVFVNPGKAFVGGQVVEVTSPEKVAFDQYDGVSDRKDMVVLSVTESVDGLKVEVRSLAGVSYDDWQETENMVPLAQVSVRPMGANIAPEDVRDVRVSREGGIWTWPNASSRPLGVKAGTIGWNIADRVAEVWDGRVWQVVYASESGGVIPVHGHDGSQVTGIVENARFADGAKGPLDRPAFGPGPWHAVYVNGDGQFMRNSSSARYKTNVENYAADASDIAELRPVIYDRIGSDVRDEVGLIAEEVAMVFPELVKFNEEGQPDDVEYDRFVVPLINAVTSLVRRVEALERSVAEYITKED